MPSNPSARRRARELLVQALYQWDLSATPVANIEAQFYAENDMDKVDGEYFRELLGRIIRGAAEADARFEPVLDRPKGDLDPISLAILRIGSDEFANRIDVPFKVVINEGVNLAKKYGPTDSPKFINGVLDKLAPRHRAPELAAARNQRK